MNISSRSLYSKDDQCIIQAQKNRTGIKVPLIATEHLVPLPVAHVNCEWKVVIFYIISALLVPVFHLSCVLCLCELCFCFVHIFCADMTK